ncbi:MAG: DUF359 domain-containing protein [Candidatus Micrarchaeia archaeon]
MYAITDNLRAKLKEPLGTLFPDAGLHPYLKSSGRKVCAVGDECAYRMIMAGVKPEIVIFDRMTKRAAVHEGVRGALSSYCRNPLRVKNPAGMITGELEAAVAGLFQKGSGCIEVEGEEDLATLVAMRCAGESWLVVYGQPDAGAVVVMGGQAAKSKAGEMLAGFEKK